MNFRSQMLRGLRSWSLSATASLVAVLSVIGATAAIWVVLPDIIGAEVTLGILILGYVVIAVFMLAKARREPRRPVNKATKTTPQKPHPDDKGPQ